MENLFNVSRVYIYLLAIIIILVVVILIITFSHNDNKKTNTNDEQEVIETKETNDFPSFDKIVYAVVDAYENEIEFPKNASYPVKVLDYLNEWPVSNDRKLQGKNYMMSKNLAGQDCDWISFNDNKFCVLSENNITD